MKKHKPRIELLVFGKDNILQYGWQCKLKINRITSQLCVGYFTENGVKLCLKASFKWKFICKKNIIFVFDPVELQNFALIFKNRTLSKTVYSAIYKNKVRDFIEPEILHQKMILPIFKKISQDAADKDKLMEILSKWIHFHQNEEKQVYLDLLKENNVYEMFYPTQDIDRPNKSRKRRYCDVDNNDDFDETVEEVKRPKTNYTNRSMDFKFGIAKHNTIMVKILIIFTSLEKSYCYEYRWSKKRQNFYCFQCQTKIAIIDVDDETGKLCAKFEKHSCSEISYDPSQLTEGKLLQKPSYEILEKVNRKAGKLLIIFNSDDQSQCHEFRWKNQSQFFDCNRCKITVKLCNENLRNEYLELKSAVPHDCPMVPYDKEKYYQFKNFVQPGDFEIQKQLKDGKEKQWLLIHANEEKTKFYKYWYSNNRNLFLCHQCRLEKNESTARLCQNEDGEEYVILSHKAHLCTPYNREEDKENDATILRQNDFKLMEETASGIPKLFIFTSKSHKFCYIYTAASKRNEILGSFHCLGCMPKAVRGGDPGASVYLHKDHNGQHYIKISDRKHICKPRKYEPEKYGIQEKTYDFIFYSPKSVPSKMYAVIMHPQNKKLCYKFLYQKEKNVFVCFPCHHKGKYNQVKLQKDENGKEFFHRKHHICEPIKYSSIQAPNYKLLSKTEIKKRLPLIDESILASRAAKKMPKNVDESKIIRSPNFQLQHCKKTNTENGRLIIYASEDRKLKYDLYFCKFSNGYRCSKCEQRKLKVNAKLHTDENKATIVILGKHDHICEPIKEDENKTTQFELRNGSKGVPNRKLIVFTSEKKELYRDYFWVRNNLFQCCGCGRKSYVFVKLVEDENGQKYVKECSKNKHVCEPKKYDPEQGNPLKLKENEKLIPSECFEFHKNKNCEADKRLFIFTSEKKEFFYAYRFLNILKKTNTNTQQHIVSIYKCDGCWSLKQYITATIIDDNENQRKYVKVNSAIEHVCQPRKCDSETYSKIDEEPKIISKKGYEIHEYQKVTGKTSKILLVFTSDKRNYVYEYRVSKNNSYVCNKCFAKKISVRANIVQKDGEECLILGDKEHVCKSVKYDPKKYSKMEQKSTIIPKEMFELHKNPNGEKDKRLIVFTSAKKDLIYEYLWEYKTSYRCGGCRYKNPTKAKIIKDGENHEVTAIELLPGEHKCCPKKYDPTKYSKLDDTESRIFSSDRFKLEKNSKGEENRRLIIFNTDKKDSVYEYNWYKGTIYKCGKCSTKKILVSASLFEDSNGKQCVRFGQNDHVCKPVNYAGKK